MLLGKFLNKISKPTFRLHVNDVIGMDILGGGRFLLGQLIYAALVAVSNVGP